MIEFLLFKGLWLPASVFAPPPPNTASMTREQIIEQGEKFSLLKHAIDSLGDHAIGGARLGSFFNESNCPDTFDEAIRPSRAVDRWDSMQQSELIEEAEEILRKNA